MNTSGKGENSKTLNSISSTNLYSLKRNDDHVFEFTTKLGVRYKTYFLDYNTLFEHYPHIVCRAYSFGLEVLEGNPASSPPDPKVGATIAEVIRLFLTEAENVIVYVCDNLDNKQLARKRKFDNWFRQYNDGNYTKYNNIALIDGVEVYNSLIVHNQNEQHHLALTAFEEVNRWAEKIEK
ncbi:DUF6169 family protein [Terrimonas ferruginea]|uniref:DUF6169 family protein n=1 Tax=Terrimonas ferruginea TaxID=249 RepID=UPI0012DD6539|nr:DUF6169 family protein [Terrimonas ferruginea]